MPVFLIIGCETIVFSFLIAAFMQSLGMGLVILGAAALIMYILFQQSYNAFALIWVPTFLASITVLMWSSYIDTWLDTNFIAIFLSFFGGVLAYFFNKSLTKEYQG